MLALILACSGPDAADRAEGLLGPFENRHAIVQVGMDDTNRVRLVVGSPVWNGVDLGAMMLGCGVPAGTVVQATLELRPETWPHEVTWSDSTDAAEACVDNALSHLPLEAPGGAEQADLLRMRIIAGAGEQPPIGRLRTPDGDLARITPPPPSYRVAMSPDAIDLDRLVVDGNNVRWPGNDLPLGAGAWPGAVDVAAMLRCEREPVGLVRTTLVLAEGALFIIDTTPESDCVEDAARDRADDILAMPLAGRTAREWSRAILVLDVPVGTW